MTHSLSNRETAVARAQLYELLAQLFLHGVTASNVATLRQLPDLAQHLDDPFDADEAAATHYDLFRLQLHPHAQLFLDASRSLGGTVAEQVAAIYREHGFEPAGIVSEADHIGHELSFLAFLNQREAAAWEADDLMAVGEAQRIVRLWLSEHMLWWLPALVIGLEQQGDAFFTATVQLTLELIMSQYEMVAAVSGDKMVAVYPFPQIPDILADEQTGLRAIAEYLLTPAYAGLVITRRDIQRLSRGGNLPAGFGDRIIMLHNLLRSAAQYDQVPAWSHAVEGIAASWMSRYVELGQTYLALTPFLLPWQRAVEISLGMLARLGTAELEDDS